jgi:hypothetical protein
MFMVIYFGGLFYVVFFGFGYLVLGLYSPNTHPTPTPHPTHQNPNPQISGFGVGFIWGCGWGGVWFLCGWVFVSYRY